MRSFLGRWGCYENERVGGMYGIYVEVRYRIPLVDSRNLVKRKGVYSSTSSHADAISAYQKIPCQDQEQESITT